MLRKVFESEPIWYMRENDCGSQCSLLGSDYGGRGSIPDPYEERLNYLAGFFVHPAKGKYSPYAIYLTAGIFQSPWPGWGAGMWRWDNTTGLLPSVGMFARRRFCLNCQYGIENARGRYWMASSIGVELTNRGCIMGRSGRLYFRNLYSTFLTDGALSGYAQAAEGDPDIAPARGVYFYDTGIPVSRFNRNTYGRLAIDEFADRLLNGSGETLTIYVLSTGEKVWSIELPEDIVDIALEDEQHAYILLSNRVLILFNYERAEVMGSTKIPPNPSGASLGQVKIAFDPFYRRILVCEKTADNPDGSATTHVIGYSLIPVPVRLTTPIPLRVPKQGRKIPVLVQVLGDMNEGVNSHVIKATVSGGASLAGAPVTDNNGSAVFPIAIEGHPQYVGSENWASEGSPDAIPPHAGDIRIDCEVVVPPDPLNEGV